MFNRSRGLSRREMLLATVALTTTTRISGAQSTPPASPVVGDSRATMLRLAHPRSEKDDVNELFWYCDIANQFEALGIERSRLQEMSDFPLFAVVDPLYSPSRIWREAMSILQQGGSPVGFNPFLAHRVVVGGHPDQPVQLWSGGISTDELPETWDSNGYTERRLDPFGSVWVHEGDDASTTELRMQLGGSIDTATVVGDDSVLFAPNLEALESALSRLNGDAPSLEGDTDARQLLATMPGNITSMTIARGNVLALDSMIANLPETAMARLERELQSTGSMPSVHLAAFGGTAGVTSLDDIPAWPEWTDREPPLARMSARLLVDSPELAAEAFDIIANRVEATESMRTGQPYGQFMPVIDGYEDPSPDDGVAAIDFAARVPWHDVYLALDLLLFAT